MSTAAILTSSAFVTASFAATDPTFVAVLVALLLAAAAVAYALWRES